MKRDMDFVRDILLKIEGSNEGVTSIKALGLAESGTPAYERLAYHVEMLIEEAGFVRGVDASSMDGADWLNLRLTWRGHEFLDTIRDPDIWRRTKQGAEKVGNWSLDFLVDAAKAYAKAKAKELLGLDL
jgi:hypothetical protein